MKRLAILAVLGLAAPALAADSAVAMSDAQLDQVAAGTGSLAPVTNLNVNASPIVVTQTAVALNTQTQTASLATNGNGKCKGQGNAYGLAKQSQVGVAAASNTAKINYHVVQINNSGAGG